METHATVRFLSTKGRTVYQFFIKIKIQRAYDVCPQLNRVLKSFLSLFLQSSCPLCQRATETELCRYCQAQLVSYQWPNPSQAWQGDLPRFIWGQYDGKLKQAIAAFKYNHHPELGEFFGYALGESWLNSPISKTLPSLTLVPIPLHPRKLKERGFNQADRIAQGFSQITRYPLIAQGLIRVKDTAPLFDLNPEQRQATLHQALRVGNALKQLRSRRPILLVDDIYTTGATARESHKVLLAQGFTVVGIVAIASSRLS